MKNVIISGADGFIGSYVAEAFANRGGSVLALDLPERPARLRESALVSYRSCNVFDAGQTVRIATQNEYDTFISLAWRGLDGKEKDDPAIQAENVKGVAASLSAAAGLGCRRFVDLGSITELFSQPDAAYPAAKKAEVEVCRRLSAELGMEYLRPLLTNAYGPGAEKGFVCSVLKTVIKGEPLLFTSAVQIYDFIYVTDVAEALFLIAEKGRPSSRYVIGSGQAAPLRYYIDELLQVCGCPVAPEYGALEYTGEMLPARSFDISSLREECGFQPTVPFEEGVRKTYEHMQYHTKKRM